MGEPSLADLLQQQRATGWDGGAMAPAGMGGPLSSGQAALGMQAMKNITGAMAPQEQLVMPGGAGIAPRGQQIQLSKTPGPDAGIDPRIQMGLAQLLFGGK